MGKEFSVTFQITIDSVKNATWQGVVSHEGQERVFKSELQLLRHMLELEPMLSAEMDKTAV